MLRVKTTQRGIDLIKDFEGCSLVAYQDGGGVWTCGYGATHGVTADTRISAEEADAWFLRDLETTEGLVTKMVKVPLNANQFSALVSFCYNVGPGLEGVKDGLRVLRNGEPSTLLKLLNSGDYEGAASEFSRWVKIAGKPAKGLELRRSAEVKLFITRVS